MSAEDEVEVFRVQAGSSLYMSGEQDWYVRAEGKPGIRATFRATQPEAARLQALLNRSGPVDPKDLVP